jgi:hypothetical protein
MRYLLSRRVPEFRRVLLVESGTRSLIEDLLPVVYSSHPALERLDVVTCYAGAPRGFDAGRGTIFRVHDYRGRPARKLLYGKLRGTGYNIFVMICSGQPIMTKWKWALAWQVPAKILIVNENGDYFFLDRSNWRIVRKFIAFRAGLHGGGAVDVLADVLLLPFTLLYLVLFAAWVHLRRKVRAI